MNENISLEKIQDAFYLPSLIELQEAFPLENSFRTDSKEFPWLCPDFTKHNVKINNYQVYTQEFIESLASYLHSRNLRIVEVGAGDGRLTYFLKRSTFGDDLDIRATDIKDWEDKGKTNTSVDVEKLGYLEALKKYSTEKLLVLSCWMNVDVAWAKDFRAEPMVQEYVLIGDVFRTADYGADWYLPAESNFECKKLSRAADDTKNKIVTGSLGRFDGSPHNPESRTEAYSFRRLM